MLKGWILGVIDYFYTPFGALIPVQTFRYAVCGGLNTLLDIFLYYISFHYVLHERILYTPAGPVSPHVAAIFLAFLVSFPTGFFLNRSIVFPGSVLRGRVQLFRYFLLVMACLLLNYIFIKLFVEQFHIFPTVSKMLTTVIVVLFSYVTQKKFTFKSATRLN